MSIPTREVPVQMIQESEIAAPEMAAAGAVVYSGQCYDRYLRRCRIYGVADGEGGTEWRVVREPFSPGRGGSGIERCFASYSEAMEWLA